MGTVDFERQDHVAVITVSNEPVENALTVDMARELGQFCLPIAAAIRLDPGTSPYTSDDRREGAAAFKGGREPPWTGR